MAEERWRFNAGDGRRRKPASPRTSLEALVFAREWILFAGEGGGAGRARAAVEPDLAGEGISEAA